MIRKARIGDVKELHKMLNAFAAEGKLLPRSLSDLYTHIREFVVWQSPENGKILGCCCLHIVWEDLAEIRSLAVLPERQGQGIGTALVRACLNEARDLGIFRVFVLTYEVRFFQNLGFRVTDKQVFPQKIWADCLHCTKFPDCDETAMVLDLADVQGASG
ncbi:MAG: N-acetyltransferase [Desulfosoma sp.]